MKILIEVLIVFTVLILMSSLVSATSTAISSVTITQTGAGRQVCVDGNRVIHVAGCTSTRVYYNRSTDNGATWTGMILTTASAANCGFGVGCDINSGNVALTYSNSSAIQELLTSTDSGATWKNTKLPRVEVSSGCNADYQSIEVRGNRVYIACKSVLRNVSAVFISANITGSINVNWTRIINITPIGETNRPTLAVNGTGTDDDDIGVAATRTDTGNDIYYRFSTNAGMTWQEQGTVETSQNTQWARLLWGTNGTNIFLASYSTVNAAIWFTNSTISNTGPWSAYTTISSTTRGQQRPTISMDDNNNPFVIWDTNTSILNTTGSIGLTNLVYSRRYGNTWTAVTNLTYPSLGINIDFQASSSSRYANDNKIHYVWVQNNSGTYRIAYDFFYANLTLIPTVSLIQPINQTSTANTSINLSCNATDVTGLKNITFFIWNSTGTLMNRTTYAVGGIFNSSIQSYNLSAGAYVWNCIAFNEINNSISDANRTILTSAAAAADTIDCSTNPVTTANTNFVNLVITGIGVWTIEANVTTDILELLIGCQIAGDISKGASLSVTT